MELDETVVPSPGLRHFDLAEDLVDDHEHQLLLVGNMPVGGARCRAQTYRDVAHGEVGDAALLDGFDGSGHEMVARERRGAPRTASRRHRGTSSRMVASSSTARRYSSRS